MARQLIMAKTAAEAAEAKNAASAFLAGGTETERLGSLVHADTLILLKNIPGLDEIGDSGEFLKIGSMCTFEKALESDLVPDYLKTALGFMASRTKRNMATIGGNISIFRCDSYLMPTLIAAGAKLELLDASGSRNIVCAERYAEEREKYRDCLITALLLTKADVRVFSRRYANTAESHACLTASMGRCGDQIRIGAAIKDSGIFVLKELAEMMEKDPSLAEDGIMSWCRSWNGAVIRDDMFGSEAYKRYLLGVTLSDMYHCIQGGDVK